MPNAGLHWSALPSDVLGVLRRGAAIPAHPLALDPARQFDRVSQRALTRYYVDAGRGRVWRSGFIRPNSRSATVGLFRPVLELAAETAAEWTDRPLVMIAGAIGRTAQAVEEARTARALGYHAVLLSLAAMKGAGEEEIVAHCRAVAAEMPLIGFYLQPAVGGIPLSRSFWARFAAIENVVAIKVAPFNRYGTLDVAFGVVAAGAQDRVTLYTGNDDHIVSDLVTPFAIRTEGREAVVRFKGGLLGHWSVWTRSAVALLQKLEAAVSAGRHPARNPRPRFLRHGLQQRCFRRGQQFRRLHPRLSRNPAAAGSHDVDPLPRPGRDAQPGPGRGHRPALRHLPRVA
jgi:hypothetical protein